MFSLFGSHKGPQCDGLARRDFLKVGALGLGGWTLSNLLRARAAAAAGGKSTRNTSVVWLWLGGGPTHIETFDPKMSAPAEFRSTVGDVETAIPGVRIGGQLPQMAKSAKRMAFIRSFAHGNSGHAGGTHYVMTGTDHPPADAGAQPIKGDERCVPDRRGDIGQDARLLSQVAAPRRRVATRRRHRSRQTDASRSRACPSPSRGAPPGRRPPG